MVVVMFWDHVVAVWVCSNEWRCVTWFRMMCFF
ncbi:hypothetical protein KC19_4G222000 [Ceratodon purpureus]|uniref:Uncharacterized protein n=1 Tax=Ceratodon purpureus TaxID=3225 RepID=A0A8T0IDJ6_CERPU|nr:hypothetical protein KC19_4G222000 [Ceratodon purpureus]